METKLGIDTALEIHGGQFDGRGKIADVIESSSNRDYNFGDIRAGQEGEKRNMKRQMSKIEKEYINKLFSELWIYFEQTRDDWGRTN